MPQPMQKNYTIKPSTYWDILKDLVNQGKIAIFLSPYKLYEKSTTTIALNREILICVP